MYGDLTIAISLSSAGSDELAILHAWKRMTQPVKSQSKVKAVHKDREDVVVPN